MRASVCLVACLTLAFLVSGCTGRGPSQAGTPTSNAPGLVPIESGANATSKEETAQPAVAPHHVSWAFNGTALATSDPMTGWSVLYCGDCTKNVTLELGLTTIVFEAKMDNGTTPQPNPTSGPRFTYNVEGSSACIRNACTPFSDLALYGTGDNPLYAVENATLVQAGSYVFRMVPQGWVPEAQKPYAAVMTAFYGEEPTEGWSYLAGDR